MKKCLALMACILCMSACSNAESVSAKSESAPPPPESSSIVTTVSESVAAPTSSSSSEQEKKAIEHYYGIVDAHQEKAVELINNAVFKTLNELNFSPESVSTKWIGYTKYSDMYSAAEYEEMSLGGYFASTASLKSGNSVEMRIYFYYKSNLEILSFVELSNLGKVEYKPYNENDMDACWNIYKDAVYELQESGIDIMEYEFPQYKRTENAETQQQTEEPKYGTAADFYASGEKVIPKGWVLYNAPLDWQLEAVADGRAIYYNGQFYTDPSYYENTEVVYFKDVAQGN